VDGNAIGFVSGFSDGSRWWVDLAISDIAMFASLLLGAGVGVNRDVPWYLVLYNKRDIRHTAR
jgi:hypothetical protein